MLRKLYDWVLRLAATPHAAWFLFLVSAAEASVFPIPPDVMLAPMVYARPERAWRLALVCTAGSIIGGIVGYGIGLFLQPAAIAILTFFGHPDALAEFQASFAKWGIWVILLKGVTPIPFKLVTIASGLAQFSFPMFVAACVITRGARFFIVAALFKRFGPTIQPIIEKRLALFTVLVITVVILGVVAAALIH
jgi:membrane protein YqaA with SNARE-associated domain